MSSKKVLLITYYWPPSGGSGVQRWMYFAIHLKKLGFEPIVVTVAEKYASYKFIDHSFLQKVSDIPVHFTKSLEPFGLYAKLTGKKSLQESIPQGFAGDSNPGFLEKISRTIRGNLFIPDARVGWNHYAFRKAMELIKVENLGLVITTGPPHSTHLIGLKLKEHTGVKWLADFRDPWTEVYYNKAMNRSFLANKLDERLERKVLSQADHVLSVGPGMLELLRRKLDSKFSAKFSFIYNGYDENMFVNRGGNTSESHFVICHLGVLSDNQPVDAFVEALNAVHASGHLPHLRKLKLQLIGKVSPNIISFFKDHCSFAELELIGYVSHDRAIQYMLDADILFNSLAETEQSGLLISGKLMEYIAACKPVICLGDEKGDAARLLAESGNGRVFSRKNANAIAAFLEDIFSGRFKLSATDFSRYSRRATALQLADLLRRL